MKKNWFSTPKSNVASNENIALLMEGHIDESVFQELVLALGNDLIINLKDIFNKVEKHTISIEKMTATHNIESIKVTSSIARSMCSACGLKTLELAFLEVEKEASSSKFESIKILSHSRKIRYLTKEYMRILGT